VLQTILLPNNQGAAVLIPAADFTLTLEEAQRIITDEKGTSIIVTDVWREGPNFVCAVMSMDGNAGDIVIADAPHVEIPEQVNQPVVENPRGWTFTNDNDPDDGLQRHSGRIKPGTSGS
jgi:hypothetical protein